MKVLFADYFSNISGSEFQVQNICSLLNRRYLDKICRDVKKRRYLVTLCGPVTLGTLCRDVMQVRYVEALYRLLFI